MPLPNEEQIILREMAHNWAQRDTPVRAFRDMRDGDHSNGFSDATFKSVANMGWTGALISEDYGGSDVGYMGFGAVVEELGRMLVAAPLLGSAVGTVAALTLAGSDAQKSTWLPGIAAGEVIGALAIDESNRYAPAKIGMRAEAKDGGYVLSGDKRLVHEGGAANVLIVAARTSGVDAADDGVTLFVVPADSAGISRERRQLIDSRGYADIRFDQVVVDAADVLGTVGEGRTVLTQVTDRVSAMIAAEAFGLAVQAFETTLEYLKTRVQFGQVIGTFQALQHRCAKMFTDIQLARPCVENALHALDQNEANASAAVSLAKATVNDLVHLISREMIQLHGGIGMTDAHDAGFYIKRARVLEGAFGTSGYHRERYARLNGV